MEEKKKVFIIGCKGRGSEVIDILKGLGAKNKMEISGENKDNIYFINHDNNITCALADSEIGAIVMDNYRDIELPRQKWIEDDILTLDNHKGCYAAFKKYNDDGTFEAYFVLDHKTVYFDATVSVESFHLASIEELEDIPRLFFFLMCNLNEVVLCLPKNVAQNPLPDYMVKRLREEND